MFYLLRIALLIFSIPLFAIELDNTIQKMSIEEKIGQLFIVPACQLRKEDHQEDLKKNIATHFIGGVILKQGNPLGQIKQINRIQKISLIPLLCVQDAEWGLSMRLEDTIRFPKNLTLGAIQDEGLLFSLGKEIGRECKKVGAHINLAPVVDVNNNPLNPIIHMRSFGENSVLVAGKASLFMQGMQEMGVLACAKHFPGHGDTSVDSHLDLPVIAHSLEWLSRIELLPFEKLIHDGVASIMTAHLYVPALSEKKNWPSSLSKSIVHDLLQNNLEFHGLIITDALNMKALSSLSPEEIAVEAFLAGNDLLLYGDHIGPNVDDILRNIVPKAISGIKNAYLKGIITEEDINRKVRKILLAKEKLGLFKQPFLEEKENLLEELNSPEAIALKAKLFEEAITLVENQGVLPLSNDGFYAAIGDGGFLNKLKQLANVQGFSFQEKEKLLSELSSYSHVIVSIENVNPKEKNYGISSEMMEFLHLLHEKKAPVILVVFGTPYSLRFFDAHPVMMVGYENDEDAFRASAEILFGKRLPKGKLPVTIDERFPAQTGLETWTK